MLNKLVSFLRRYEMVQPGDRVTCAVSGGADSMALLWAMYLLKDKLDIQLSAAHYNHGLRGEESDRDEAFVRDFCAGYGIPFFSERGKVTAGDKGLEAAARDARYAFFKTLPGKIATAHTADDNAETVLMHMVRGTGLKGLGGITPVNGCLIRPMLSVTRQEVCGFLAEYSIPHISDSSNDTDAFLRNRLRRHVMPLLKEENPRLAENLTAMALRLREDEAALAQDPETNVDTLKKMPSAKRNRALAASLQSWGVKEPEAQHIMLLESLVFSPKPSCKVQFPGGVTIRRNYSRLEKATPEEALAPMELSCPGEVVFSGIRVICTPSETAKEEKNCFTVCPTGKLLVRSRLSGDAIRLPGGTKSLKKLFIDAKIPAHLRQQVPVVVDEKGVLGVYGFGPDGDRRGPGVQIRFIEDRGESRKK